MEPLAQMNCPACGSPALVQESVTTLRCENCNSVVQRSSSTSFLEVLGVGCYSCGAVNEKGIKFCTTCGTKLIVDCLKCGNPIVLGQKRCGQCGGDIYKNYKNKVNDINQNLEEHNKKVLYYDKRVEENRSSKQKISKRRTILIILGFFIALFGSLIMAILLGLVDKSEFFAMFMTSLCTISPIIGGIFFFVIVVLVFLYTNSEQHKLDNKIKYANIYKEQELEEINLLENENNKYLKLMSAYKRD